MKNYLDFWFYYAFFDVKEQCEKIENLLLF